MITKSKIISAFNRFDAGEHPSPHGKPKRWYVQGSNSNLYPLKHIYSLATGISSHEFHTRDARQQLQNLGFTVIDVSAYEEINEALDKAVKQSINEPQARQKRLQLASPIAQEKFVIQRIFLRNPDVVAETLVRANGFCEYCKSAAPFLRAKDSTPYLEVHHRTPLAKGGKDTVSNSVALCPNCHRQAHFG